MELKQVLPLRFRIVSESNGNEGMIPHTPELECHHWILLSVILDNSRQWWYKNMQSLLNGYDVFWKSLIPYYNV